ncbi:Helicase conserved C-terminal domain containing protein [Plasmodiophora brassicae]
MTSTATGDVMCCGGARRAVRREVRKAGPNQGRFFYGCPLFPRPSQCRFFKWESDVVQSKVAATEPPICNNPFSSMPLGAIEKQIATLKDMLADTALVSRTPDNGKRMKEKLRLLEEAATSATPTAVEPVSGAHNKKLISSRPSNPNADIDTLERSLAGLSLGRSSSDRPLNDDRASVTISHVQSLLNSLSKKENVQEVQPSDALLSKLYRHQRQALSWMCSREEISSLRQDEPAGGILADDMGLGKTLQMISLILTSKPVSVKDNDEPSTLISSNATLIVCPLAVLSQWADEIDRHVAKNRLRVLTCHGPKRDNDPNVIASFDVVLTTYQVAVSSYKMIGNGPLHSIRWRRVVLDEAHFIKNASTMSAKAVFELEAMCRWFMSATPLQNQLQDLYSPMKFLRFMPYADFNQWNTLFGRGKFPNRQNVERLRTVLQSVMLRRSKADRDESGKLLIDLPHRALLIHKLRFSPSEQQVYNELQRHCKQQFASAYKGDQDGGYKQMLTSLLRLRQSCCGLATVETKAAIDVASDTDTKECDDLSKSFANLGVSPAENHALKVDLASGCEICFDPVAESVSSAPCGHAFCTECISTALQTREQCPTCQKRLTKDDLVVKRRPLNDGSAEVHPVKDHVASSTKVKFLLKELAEIEKRPGCEKSVIFSQWTTLLDALEPVLSSAGYQFARLDGSMTKEARQSAVKRFRDTTTTNVFLLSLKCAGVGLNLTAANHCFSLDVWWNGAVEDQAFDRIYRIGQTKPVFIHRLVIANSIEENVLDLQKRKQRLATDILGSGSVANVSKVKLFTMDDLKRLLNV